MTVKIHELRKYIGTTIEIKCYSSKYVPNGVYIVLGKDEHGILIGNLLTRDTTLIEEYDEDSEVSLVDYKVNLEELVEFKLARCVHLIHDGYIVGNHFDLTPYLTEYGSLLLLKKLSETK